MRAFHAERDGFHLLTNSRHLVTRFLEAVGGKGQLGQIREFRYARGRLPAGREHAAVLYLSDPFFRNITSPRHRIERSRRRQARRDLEALALARLAAQAEGRPAESIGELVRGGFLPPLFGERADGSRPVLASGRCSDSLRGVPGSFVPVADVAVLGATQREVEDYRRFTRAYLREWRAMDPVVVAFSRRPSARADREQVLLDVLVTPYARQEYAFLSRHLAETDTRRIAAVPGELLSLSARLQDGSTTRDVHAGIVDGEVGHIIEDGQLQRLDEFARTTFARRNAYAAVHPSGLNGLKLLGRFAESVEGRGRAGETASLPQTVREGVGLFGLLTGRPQTQLRYILEGLHALSSAARLSAIDSRETGTGTWSVMARSRTVREAVFEDLEFEDGPRPAQVVLRLEDVRQAAVYDYLRAYRYVQSRRDSAAAVRVVNGLAARLDVAPEAAREAVEEALGERLCCPVGGEFVLRPSAGGRRWWTGTAWQRPVVDQEDGVPAAYRFAFLDWLRGMELEFSLSQTTLSSRVALEVATQNLPKSLHVLAVNTGTGMGRHRLRIVTANRPAAPATPELPEVPREAATDILITNDSGTSFSYRVQREGGPWGELQTLRPGRRHRFRIDYPIVLRPERGGRSDLTLRPGSRWAVLRGGSGRLVSRGDR